METAQAIAAIEAARQKLNEGCDALIKVLSTADSAQPSLPLEGWTHELTEKWRAYDAFSSDWDTFPTWMHTAPEGFKWYEWKEGGQTKRTLVCA